MTMPRDTKHDKFRYWSCGRKRWFRTQAQAESAIVNMCSRAYHCTLCDGWHLTTTKPEGGVIEQRTKD